MTLRVAFRVARPSAWMGGVNYLLNMCRVLRRHAPDIEPVLFVPPGGGEQLEARYAEAVGGVPILMPERSVMSNNFAVLGFDTGADMRMFADHGIDLVFESSGYYGVTPPIPVLSWLPDFQHRRLPSLFSRRQWWLRDMRFRRVISTRQHLLLSSQSARRDMGRYYGQACGSVHVVPFVVQLERPVSWADGERARNVQGLPERYFFLPNQFWSHKNHRIVVEALALLGEDAPVVAASGSQHDPRAPTMFQELQARAAALGVSDCFRPLGQLPYPELLALNARADRLINPSLFEGWSTTVEEARALGTPMILSDIDVHREQAPPGTIFFAPNDVADCACALRAAMDLPARYERPLTAGSPAGEATFAKLLSEAFASAAKS